MLYGPAAHMIELLAKNNPQCGLGVLTLHSSIKVVAPLTAELKLHRDCFILLRIRVSIYCIFKPTNLGYNF